MTIRRTVTGAVAGAVLGAWAAVAVAQEAAPAAPPAATLEERLAKLEAKMAAPDAIKMSIYGRLRMDAAYDTHRITPGNYALYVQSEEVNTNDDEFNLTANTSRLGLNLAGPDSADYRLTGKVEVDFLTADSENSPHIRMRHAYVELARPAWDLSLLAGQTWDLHSALIMPILDDGAGWDAGNIGFRRAQVRLTKTIGLGGERKLVAATALARTIGDPIANSPGDTGEDAGFPTVEARLAYVSPLWVEKQAAVFALSGHRGAEQYDLAANGRHKTLQTWSACAEVELPVTARVKLAGEAWAGKNLDAYLGGIGQGVNAADPTDPYGIHALGGWAAVSVQALDSVKLNAGAGIDDPNDSELNDGQRERNSVVFVNGWYTVTKAFKVAAEYSLWNTAYQDAADGQANRWQAVIQYEF